MPLDHGLEMLNVPVEWMPVRAEIRKSALLHNLTLLRNEANPAVFMGVVKANAYGHGAVQVAHVLAEAGVRDFAVATLQEALQLRKSGLEGRILVLGVPHPDALPVYAQADLDVNVASPETASAVLETSFPLRIHVKVDTGMHRLGLLRHEAAHWIPRLLAAPNLMPVALWTHFASADEPKNPEAQLQLSRFEALWKAWGHGFAFVHVANSAGILNHLGIPEAQSIVRGGIALYGYDPDMPRKTEALQPVMRLVSRIVRMKTVQAGTAISYGGTWRAPLKTNIATLSCGYGDGYPRQLSSVGWVSIHGKRYTIAGRVCMDMLMVDAGQDTSVRVGDEVTLFGDGVTSLDELAPLAQTIPYTMLTGIMPRVPRIWM